MRCRERWRRVMSSGAMIRTGSSKLSRRNLRNCSAPGVVVLLGAGLRPRLRGASVLRPALGAGDEGPRKEPGAARGAIDKDGAGRALGVRDHDGGLCRQMALEAHRRIPAALGARELVGAEQG